MNLIILVLGIIIAYSTGTAIEIIGKKMKWSFNKTSYVLMVAFVATVIIGAAIIQIFNL